MYICLCNALTEKEVEAAILDGARTPADVYRSLGCEPQCGTCLRDIRHRLKNIRRRAVDPEPSPSCALTTGA